MIKVEYVRDMHKNYLVLQGLEGKVSAYGVKMLLNNQVPGLLPVELRCIDHLDLFYYDITSKKAIDAFYESKSFNYVEMHALLTSIFQTIEQGYEYLLLENDYIIDPNFIYMDCDTKQFYLCHLVGHQINIQEQLTKFVEYLMNKVDYKDDKAVLLIYAIYKACRDSDCTFDKLKNELDKQYGNNKDLNKSINSNESYSKKANNKEANYKQANNKETNNKETNNKHINNQDQSNKCESIKNRNIIDINKNEVNNKIKNMYLNEDGNDLAKRHFVKQKVYNKNHLERSKTNNLDNKIKNKVSNSFKLNQISKRTNKTNNQVNNNNNMINSNTINNNTTNHNMNYNVLNTLANKMNEAIEKVVIKITPRKMSSQKINQLKKQNHKYEPILEEIESEQEVHYYGKQTYFLAITSLIIGIIIIGVVYSQRLLHNSFGTSLDPVKVISSIIIIGCLQAYVMLQLFQKKNKLVKIVPCTNYVEPGENSDKSMFENGVSMVSSGDGNMIYDGVFNTIDKNQEENDETQILWTNQDDYEDKTVILADLSNKVDSYLVPLDLEDNKKIPISEYPFVIGKSGNSVNYIINKTGISRIHAKITKEGDNYYLFDLKSTNGTYVNNLKLKENTPYILNDRDEIAFSKIKFSWVKTD